MATTATHPICNVIVVNVHKCAVSANNGNIPLKVNYPINKIINSTSFRSSLFCTISQPPAL
jgi:hypothetical protein